MSLFESVLNYFGISPEIRQRWVVIAAGFKLVLFVLLQRFGIIC
jgi:hypothetical protein